MEEQEPKSYNPIPEEKEEECPADHEYQRAVGERWAAGGGGRRRQQPGQHRRIRPLPGNTRS